MNGHTGLPGLGVRRPVLVAVANLLIILAGVAALKGVDVRELPNVERPVVAVRATLPGGSPETIDAEVTRVLEGGVARVPGAIRIESASEENNARLRIEFSPATDLATAANDVREAISQVQRELPDAIEELLVLKADDDAEAIIQVAAWSDTLPNEVLARRIEKAIAPELLSIPGVADVRLDGIQPRVLKVRLDPVRMAAYRVPVADVVAAIRNARFDVPAGSYASDDQEFIVRAWASVVDPARFERLRIRDNLRMEDIAEVYYAPRELESWSLLNGRRVVGLGIVRQAGSNTIAISREAARRVERINARARDFSLAVIADDAVYIRGALRDVLFTLAFSIGIVLVVIALFLRQWRAVLIPAVTMPVSLIGTLAAVWLFGFSINLLTLLALVLATGLIVDDAIVVLENIQRRRAMGLGAMAAAVLGTGQVFFAVVATTLTLVAVFLPIALLPGDTGRLFREFGLTLAIAVVISSFVALTLCPMMAARLPPPRQTTGCGVHGALAIAGEQARQAYFKSLRAVLGHRFLSLLLALAIVAGGIAGFLSLGQELLPQEDRGSLRILLTGPDGASLSYADRQAAHVEAALAPWQADGLVTDIYTIVGSWDPHRSFTTATLSPWGERGISQMALARALDDSIGDLPGAQVRIIQGSSLSRRGPGGLEVALLGIDYAEIHAAAGTLAAALVERVPAVADVNVKFDTSQPELRFNIDRERAADLGVSMDSISLTLQIMVDRFEALDLNVDDETVPVVLSSSGGAVDDPGDLLNLFVTNNTGELVPLGALIDVEERGVAAQLDRHAQSRAIEMDIGIPPGTSLGGVMDAIRDVANEVLPPGTGILFLGEAAALDESSREVAITFLLAAVVVFLVLAAQFESIGSAVIVMLTVPLGLAAAMAALLVSGQTLNLYSQIGLVMLVGIMTKNAILLVEFMDQLRDAGRSVDQAIAEAVDVRLRPVVMTVLSTVLGSLPLILSSGPGAEARNAIGHVVFGGVGISALFTLYFAPLGYAFIAPRLKPRAHAGEQLAAELDDAEP